MSSTRPTSSARTYTQYATRDLKAFQANPFLHFWNAWLPR